MAEQSNIPNLDGLAELAHRDGVDIKPTLLRVVTDLYVQKPVHSAEEERHYTELALRLIDGVDAPTRAIVADRLAHYPAAPEAVVARLSRKGHERRDPAPAPSSQVAARETEPLPRHDPAAEELSELFMTADGAERRLILLNLKYAPLAPAAPMTPAAAHDAVALLEMAALSHNTETFAHEAERALGISRAQARRLIHDPSGEPIVVMAVALGIPAEVLQNILLSLNPAISQSVLRVYELTTLYEEVEPEAALRLLAIWRAAGKARQRPAAHAPQLWHGKADERPEPATRQRFRWEEHIPALKAENQ